MTGPTHRLLGAIAGAGYATVAGWSTGNVIAAAVVATITSAGWLSPDVDQTRPVRWVRRHFGRLFAHRQLTHWWLLPLVGWALVPLLEVQWQPVAQALVLGWASHILGDFIFGRVPLVPTGPFLGLGLDTGGKFETGKPLRGTLALVLVWLLVGAPTFGLLPEAIA